MSRRDHPVLDAQFAAENPDLGVLYNLISGFGKRPPPQTVLAELANDRFDPEAIARITLPTLLIAGTRDVHCPPEAMQSVADLIPGARLVALEGSHSLYYESPDAWNDARAALLGPAAMNAPERPAGPRRRRISAIYYVGALNFERTRGRRPWSSGP